MGPLSCMSILYILGQIFHTATSACTDQNVYCNAWRDAGECPLNPAYMLCYCSLSCNTNSDCAGGQNADTTCDCEFNAAKGLCEHGNITGGCPYTCSRRQNVICKPPQSFPNAIAVGHRRHLDRVTYICRHGYRNAGNVGLRVCNEASSWTLSNDPEGDPPNCIHDPSIVIPCEQMTFTFNPVSRTSVDRVSILSSEQGYTVAECLTWCQRVPGCSHAAFVSGSLRCFLYYNVARYGFGINEGEVWERKRFLEPVYYYT